jgi:FkbM family methyltransferase
MGNSFFSSRINIMRFLAAVSISLSTFISGVSSETEIPAGTVGDEVLKPSSPLIGEFPPSCVDDLGGRDVKILPESTNGTPLTGYDPAGIAGSESLNYERLNAIHSTLKLLHGLFSFEFPEQLITATYLSPDAKVLELGSNLGNNSCVIARILNDARNLVTLETRPEAVKFLIENRDYNNLSFHVEGAALSEVPLVQKGWIAIPSEVDLEGYTRLNTITFDQLLEKYGVQFDTLVVDAEGSLYDILVNKPSILNNIKMIIIENDFRTSEHLLYAVDLFCKNGFELIYNGSKPLDEGNAFNQVWKKPYSCPLQTGKGELLESSVPQTLEKGPAPLQTPEFSIVE